MVYPYGSIYDDIPAHRSHRSFSKRNNYLQYLRSQTFMQEKPKYKKTNKNYSEDISEFDDYEDDESDAVEEDIIRSQGEQRRGSSSRDGNANDKSSSSSSSRSGQGSESSGTRGSGDGEGGNTLEFKNIEKELNNKAILSDERGVNLASGGRECAVSERGTLDVSLNANDIFNLSKYMVEITLSSILIKDVNTSNVMKEILFERIKLPIETIEETRECWYIKYNKEKIFFCEKKKEDRDRWITNMLKALFCYNTNNLIIENNQTNFNTKIDIPKESTVNERLEISKKKLNTINDKSPQNTKQTNNNNIVISNLHGDKPQILIT
ncbi:conserved Plasmodium protein, unknown function [Plasmodium ovale curtisi]|uniref:PH domain-containing protein n=1 Tax=Plasmodium ovale curtisi TaxID=864141 RepID=A0A1A8VL55_PLAOA|nr:conserved Plasmodium protein, unknown function [Plasmodium ovale curtisi]SBS82378.1 conserved Plasmodium protein, unknown function [Plasmodium ovale curtisi]